MSTIDLDEIDRAELVKMYLDAERDVRDLEKEVKHLESEIADLEEKLDEAPDDDELAGLNADEFAQAIDMIAAGDMSGALWTIRRACDDAKVQDACGRAFLRLKCLVPA